MTGHRAVSMERPNRCPSDKLTQPPLDGCARDGFTDRRTFHAVALLEFTPAVAKSAPPERRAHRRDVRGLRPANSARHFALSQDARAMVGVPGRARVECPAA